MDDAHSRRPCGAPKRRRNPAPKRRRPGFPIEGSCARAKSRRKRRRSFGCPRSNVVQDKRRTTGRNATAPEHFIVRLDAEQTGPAPPPVCPASRQGGSSCAPFPRTIQGGKLGGSAGVGAQSKARCPRARLRAALRGLWWRCRCATTRVYSCFYRWLLLQMACNAAGEDVGGPRAAAALARHLARASRGPRAPQQQFMGCSRVAVVLDREAESGAPCPSRGTRLTRAPCDRCMGSSRPCVSYPHFSGDQSCPVL